MKAKIFQYRNINDLQHEVESFLNSNPGIELKGVTQSVCETKYGAPIITGIVLYSQCSRLDKYPKVMEKVFDCANGQMFRMRVPKGWLIQNIYDNAGVKDVSITHLHDPKGEWVI